MNIESVEIASNMFADISESNPQLGRRTLLKGAGLGGLLAMLQAYEDIGPLWIENVPYWFPYDPATAAIYRRQQGLVPNILDSLHGEGGPFHKYDIAHQRILGNIPTTGETPNALEIEHDYVQDYLQANPGTAAWSGYCRQLAIIGLLERPSDFIAPEIANLGITSVDIIGWKIIKYISAPVKYSSNTREGIIAGLRRFPNQKLVINAPDRGQAGRWYRAVKAVRQDSTVVRATNFGYGIKEISVDNIVSVHMPVYVEHYYGHILPNEFDADINSRARGARYNAHINGRLLDYLASGKYCNSEGTYDLEGEYNLRASLGI